MKNVAQLLEPVMKIHACVPSHRILLLLNSIRIHYECEAGIGKSIPRITICHYEACRAMTNSDLEGLIFLGTGFP